MLAGAGLFQYGTLSRVGVDLVVQILDVSLQLREPPRKEDYDSAKHYPVERLLGNTERHEVRFLWA